MNSGINRREFLKHSAATGMLISAGDRIMEGVMAQALYVKTVALCHGDHREISHLSRACMVDAQGGFT